ncbi:MAG: hypothetical protein RL169_1716 [Armatimonadota bacterium]
MAISNVQRQSQRTYMSEDEFVAITLMNHLDEILETKHITAE